MDLTTLPPPLIHLILSHLSPPHLSALKKTSALLRTITLAYLTSRRQHTLAHTRSLQASVTAANLPNELLQEVFSYLSPLDFYIATQVCSAWRGAAGYPRLVRKNVLAAQPPQTVPPAGCLDGELKTLAFYLQVSGQLLCGRRACIFSVSTLYLKPQGEEMSYPEIHPSENGLYFLAAERAWPWRVHVYSTCRLVFPEDVDEHGGSRGFHEWDVTPTYILTLPDTGRVVSASFGEAIYGGVEYDKKTRSYSKGLDLLVLFEGAKGRLYKIRAVSRTDSNTTTTTRRALGKRVLGWATSENSGVRQRWRIWDSMEFPNVCPFPGGPMIAKLWQSRRVIFATAGHLEVWKGIDKLKESRGRRGRRGSGTVWDKDAAARKIYRTPDMPGKVAGIFTGFTWHSGLATDVDYIVCSNSPIEKSGRSMIENTPYKTRRKTLGPQEPSTVIITPTESFTFNYTNLVECQGYNGSPLFLGLTPSNTLTQLQLISTLSSPTLDNWHPDAWGCTSYQPCTLITKSTIPTPSTFTHIAAVCMPGCSIHLVIAATTSSGNIYICIPPPCSTPCTAGYYKCPSSSHGFTKVARVPPETGGRITHVRISFRCAVWASWQRKQLHEEYLRPAREGVLVLVITTHTGRVEVCYFEFGARELGGLVGKWDVGAGKVVAR